MTVPEGNPGDSPDQATVAFRRLLKDAATADEARVDALIALSQRTVFAAMWQTAPDEIRTLTNSKGETAMPLFTGMDELRKAARRFAWLSPNGSLKYEELGARAALRQALARSVQFVVIDIGADHAVEFVPTEIKPLLAAQPKRESTGPFAATGKLSTDLLHAVRQRSYSIRPLVMRPGAVSNSKPPRASRRARGVRYDRADSASIAQRISTLPPPAPPPSPQRPSSVPAVAPLPQRQRLSSVPTVSPLPRHPSSVPASPSSLSRSSVPASSARESNTAIPAASAAIELPNLVPLSTPMSEGLLEAINDSLRQFPEVDWACALERANDGITSPVIALRVDPGLPARVDAITDAVQRTANAHRLALEVLLLDSVEITRAARAVGNIFYPWRK
jgi:hypothetical protein